MERTFIIEIPDTLYESLLLVAERAGQTPQEWVLRWLIREVQAALEDPLERFIGAFRSDVPDWSDRHDFYIGQMSLK